jgi:hypothetical protein
VARVITDEGEVNQIMIRREQRRLAVVEARADRPQAQVAARENLIVLAEPPGEIPRVRAADDGHVNSLKPAYGLDQLPHRPREKPRLRHIASPGDDDLPAQPASPLEEHFEAAPRLLVSGPVQVGADEEEVDARVEGRADGVGGADGPDTEGAHFEPVDAERVPLRERR